MVSMKVDPEKLAQLAERVVKDIRGGYTDLKSIKGLLGAVAVVPRVVKRVEDLGKELGLLGSDKKEIAVAAVLALVPDRWVPDAVLEPIVRFVIERHVPSA